jgi:Fungal Zn(2)-Cys(6) binuclear cluster domain
MASLHVSQARERNSAKIPKLRISCNNCSTSKIKCSKEKPECFRCVKKGISCQYHITKRSGRKQTIRPSDSTISPSSLDLVAESDMLAPTDIVQLSPRPPTTEYIDVSSAPTSLVEPTASSLLTLNALNWEFEDFSSPPISLGMSAEMAHAACSFNDENATNHSIGFERSAAFLSSILLPSSLQTAVTQESEASSSVPKPTKSQPSIVDTPNPGPTCCFLVRALGLLKQQFSSAPESCGGCMRSSLETTSRSDKSSTIESLIADND